MHCKKKKKKKVMVTKLPLPFLLWQNENNATKKKVAFYDATNENKEGVYLQTFVLGPAWVPLQAFEALMVKTLMIGGVPKPMFEGPL